MTRTVVLSLGLAFVLLVLVGFCLRVGLGYLLAYWADCEEARSAAERRRLDAAMHEPRPVNYPPAKGAKGFANDVRHRRHSA